MPPSPALRCLLLLCALLLPCLQARAELSLTFLDVGQGDATLIVSPAGKRVLVDGGPPEARQALLAALRRRGADRLDLIVLTHPHMDHLGGLTDVVRALPTRLFLDSGFPHPSPGYSNLLNALAERGVALRQAEAGRKIDLGEGATLLLVGPPRPYLSGTRSDVNANSVVARLSWRGVSALLTGDAEPETEAHLLARGAEVQAGLLKVAHHGSKHSSGAAFLRAVRPQIAVISAGAGNDYGHPTQEALSRLQAAGARVYRTDLGGEITVRSPDGQRWEVEEGRPGQAQAQAQVTSAAPRAAPPGPAAGRGGLPGAQRGPSEVWASQRAEVFHRADCPAVSRIKPDNRVRFPSREAALASGRRPAGDCHP